MKVYSAKATEQGLPYPELIATLRQLFAEGVNSPPRHSHTVTSPGKNDDKLLLMPAWHDKLGCVKIVNVVPDNGQRQLPAVTASLLVFDRKTGKHLALLDGDTVTARRTAAVSALAADCLAPPQASRLLILGAGHVAAQLPAAFKAVRPITQISIWNRTTTRAEKLINQLQQQAINATLCQDLPQAAAEADILSAATLSTTPLIKGRWLHAKQHIDLIGSFTPTMREADDQAIQQAAIYVDTTHTIQESGEIAIPLQKGLITAKHIRGDLYDLTRPGNQPCPSDTYTLFKAAGSAVMDLAAAMTFVRSVGLVTDPLQ